MGADRAFTPEVFAVLEPQLATASPGARAAVAFVKEHPETAQKKVVARMSDLKRTYTVRRIHWFETSGIAIPDGYDEVVAAFPISSEYATIYYFSDASGGGALFTNHAGTILGGFTVPPGILESITNDPSPNRIE